jgi:AcrR family transcriptional regulator
MASNKKDKPRRRYELKERARRQERTRLRITEAAVELHGTVGPARTTISEVAKCAGVRRMTVYNHFATDADLFDACSTHWLTGNPPPDAAAWTRIDDSLERTRVALGDMYAYYRANEAMIGNVLRDAPLIPALGAIMDQKWWPAIEGMVDVLVVDREPDPAHVELRATIRLVLDFSTWRTLARSGLDDERAARLAARFVAAIATETG